MVHGLDRKYVSCYQYIGSLVTGAVIHHSSFNNENSSGTNLASKSIKNSLFARFRNDEAIFSKKYHICMGVKLTRTRGDDTISAINSSLYICESFPSNNPIQIFSSLLLPCFGSRNNKIRSSRRNRWWYVWEGYIDSASIICNSFQDNNELISLVFGSFWL